MSDEKWLPVHGFEDCYEVSSYGRVRSLGRKIFVSRSRHGGGYWRTLRGRVLKPSIGSSGYQQLTLWRDAEGTQCAVHVLVLEAFVGSRPDGYYGCHVDGFPSNNRLSNLYWGTPAENASDKRTHGTHRQGSAISWAKLSEKDVERIRSLKGATLQSALASEYGVRQGHISRIMNGREWRHVGLS